MIAFKLLPGQVWLAALLPSFSLDNISGCMRRGRRWPPILIAVSDVWPPSALTGPSDKRIWKPAAMGFAVNRPRGLMTPTDLDEVIG